MGQKKRFKLCQYCDGQVDLDVIICPYCGNEVSEKKDEPVAENSLYTSIQQKRSGIDETGAPYIKEEALVQETEKVSLFWPTMLFALGLNLVVMGFFILLFSTNGELLLRWESKFWFVYVLFALPLLFVGYKGLIKSKES